MSQKYHFFTIPVHGNGDEAAGLNEFLASHRIVSVDRHFVSNSTNSLWAVCIAFDDSAEPRTVRNSMIKRGKTDFRDLLSPPEFAVFARLRP